MTDRDIAPPAHPWDGYLVGEENALAHSGVIALARGDDPGLSPLVIHGPSGVGKSRLMNGLVAETIARHPGAIVAHLSAEEFAAMCAEAANRRGGFSDLRERFRRLTLFVLDDLHALDRAPLALTELAHTLDALNETGAAVAATARLGPARWQGWPERLVSRFVAGLSVRIEPPGPESRRRFVLERSRARGLKLSAATVEAIAEKGEDYRTLEGLIAHASLSARIGRKPGEDATDEDPGIDDRAQAEKIAKTVADRFGVTLRDLRSASRRQALVVPRHLAIHLVRKGTSLSFASIGRYFGKRDAATIRHACKAAEQRLANDPGLAAEIAAIDPMRS